jgi:hypothetical protein
MLQGCGTNAACSYTATTGGQIVFGSVAFYSLPLQKFSIPRGIANIGDTMNPGIKSITSGFS